MVLLKLQHTCKDYYFYLNKYSVSNPFYINVRFLLSLQFLYRNYVENRKSIVKDPCFLGRHEKTLSFLQKWLWSMWSKHTFFSVFISYVSGGHCICSQFSQIIAPFLLLHINVDSVHKRKGSALLSWKDAKPILIIPWWKDGSHILSIITKKPYQIDYCHLYGTKSTKNLAAMKIGKFNLLV